MPGRLPAVVRLLRLIAALSLVVALAAVVTIVNGQSAANSAALWRDERVWFDYVRPGLLLYGVVPPPLHTTLELRPALSLTSRIVAVKGLRPGEATGYGLKTPVDSPASIAIVPASFSISR